MSNTRIGYDETQIQILEELKLHRSESKAFALNVVERLAVLETTLNVVPTIGERVRVLELFKYQLLGITIGSSTVLSILAATIGWLFRGAKG
jgi:hypothetical protein